LRHTQTGRRYAQLHRPTVPDRVGFLNALRAPEGRIPRYVGLALIPHAHSSFKGAANPGMQRTRCARR
jgi:hypothetical protein